LLATPINSDTEEMEKHLTIESPDARKKKYKINKFVNNSLDISQKLSIEDISK